MTTCMRLLPAVLCLVLVLLSPARATEEGGAHVHIGVLAYRGAEQARARWQPVAEALHAALPGIAFSIVPLSLDGTDKALTQRRIDLLITNPGHFVSLEEPYSLAALATRALVTPDAPQGLRRFGSAVVVRAESQVHYLADLAGRRVAAVSPDAFGGFLVAWEAFHDRGIDPFADFGQLIFLGFPQDEILRAVAAGEVDAGIVRGGLVEAMVAEGRLAPDALRVLQPRRADGYPYAHSTDLYPEWVLAAAPWMPAERADAVLLALLTGKAAPPAGPGGERVQWTAPASYAPVRRLMRAYAEGRAPASGPERLWPWLVGGGAALVVLAAAGDYLFRGRRMQRPERPDGEVRRARRRLEALTQREREVLALVARGASTKAAANRLGISVKTVEFHRGNLLKKTGARSAAELARLATLAAARDGGADGEDGA